MSTSFAPPKVMAVVAVSAMLLAAPAQAERRAAPIVFGETATSPSASQAAPVALPQAPTQSYSPDADAKTRRLEFRYPDQPDVYYGDGGARAAGAGDAPMAFSSSTAAIDPGAARQFAALPEPQVAAPQQLTPRDPSITAGGFDARAAAARVAEKRATAPAQPIRVTANSSEVARPVGKPLTLSRVSVNRDATMSEETGKAGIYTEGFEGRPTANGEIYQGSAMTAAHPSLPLPSLVQVINQRNGREIVVRVNDRGPFAGGRIIDLTPRAGNMLGFAEGQTTDVLVRYLGPAPVAKAPQSAAAMQVEQESLPPVAMPAPQSVAYQPQPQTQPQPQAMPAPVYEQPLSGAGLGNFYIQAGSFADIGNAQRLTSALGRSMQVEITEARVRNADYFRVMIGPFATRQEAEVQRAQLRSTGIADGIVVTR